MNDEIVIRIALVEDAEEIRRVQKETWLTTYPNAELGITYNDVAAEVNSLQAGSIERLITGIKKDLHSRRWVAIDEKNIVGYLSAKKLAGENKINALYVLDGYQGQGIGKKLMKEALAWFGDEKRITLEVATYNNQAINFYKSFGFVEQRSTAHETSRLPEGTKIPEIVMIRE